MRAWMFLLVAAALMGCSLKRYVVLPPPAEVVAAEPNPATLWRVGQLYTRVTLQTMAGVNATATTDVEELKQQVTSRIRQTLEAQQGLGATTGPAHYSLEVLIDNRETMMMSDKMPLGLLVEVGILGLGALVGGVVASVTARTDEAVYGTMIGMGASLPFALGGALLVNTGRVRGEYEANLTLRRLSDRVPVSSRRVFTTWALDYNVWGAMRKIAVASGEGLPAFEAGLVQAVKDMMTEVAPPPMPSVSSAR